MLNNVLNAIKAAELLLHHLKPLILTLALTALTAYECWEFVASKVLHVATGVGG